VAAQVRAEGWRYDEVEADDLAMLTLQRRGPMCSSRSPQAAPFESSRQIG